MLNRRDFLALMAAHAGVMLGGCGRSRLEGLPRTLVNDVHSRLNPTTVLGPIRPTSVAALRETIRSAVGRGLPIATCGSRHAMGGQQFAQGALLIDTSGMRSVLSFDRERGLVEVDAGIEWPALIEYLLAAQADDPQPWTISQKQTGADHLTIGGAVAANIHGRGLRLQPFAQDVESLVLVDAQGEMRRCSRSHDADVFRLVIGGYGLLGVVSSVQLRLTRRTKIERLVVETTVDDLMPLFAQRIADGFTFGDFQYAIDETSPDFLRAGILSCYRPVPLTTPMPQKQERMSSEAWRTLARLAHEDRGQAYRVYADYYRSTSGQIYWSDLHQLSTYVADYHATGAGAEPASDMITEIYVPRDRLTSFLTAARASLRAGGVPVVYGTIRLIEADDTSLLAWARQPWACTIFNLHVSHARVDEAAAAFRGLIDCAIAEGGSYYLTYHRWATRSQVEACHPRMLEFLRLKRRHDPHECFISDWYRHHRELFADVL